MDFKSFPDALLSWAEYHPDKVLAVEGEKSITYRQHLAAALSFADYLVKKDIKKGDRVVILAEHTIVCLNAMMGCHILGAVIVPIEKNSPQVHVDNMCERFAASAVICTSDVAEGRLFIDVAFADNIDEQYAGDIQLGELPEFPDVDDILSIMFTTGTTGTSKGVVLSVYSQMALAENSRSVIYRSDDVLLNPLPLNHASGIRRYYGIVVSGGTMVLLGSPLMMKSFFDAIKKNSVNAIAMTSSHAEMILNFGTEEFAEIGERLRFIEFCSSSPSKPLQDKLRNVLPHTKLISTYGMTEAGVISVIDFHDSKSEECCLGKPIVEGTMYLGDDDGRPVDSKSTESWRIYLTGATVMNEYYGEPALTAAVLKNGILKTTDMGHYDEAGFIRYMGRTDDVINSGAYKIAPQEIESVANQMPNICECVCVSVPDNVLGNVPKLFVVMESGREFSFKQIYSYLSERLDKTILPRYIEQINEIPKTKNGKILRRKL